jgi:hypothetical protein
VTLDRSPLLAIDIVQVRSKRFTPNFEATYLLSG